MRQHKKNGFTIINVTPECMPCDIWVSPCGRGPYVPNSELKSLWFGAGNAMRKAEEYSGQESRAMKVGIIGAGQIGGTLTRRLTDLGHEVFVANSRGPDTLSGLAAKTGATAVSAPEAVHGVDLVIVTIPEKNIPQPAG